MAASGIAITVELRPCLVNGKKALFHKWTEEAQIQYNQYYATANQLKTTFGIIEFEDGQVASVAPYKIKFCDNKMKEYYFKEGGG